MTRRLIHSSVPAALVGLLLACGACGGGAATPQDQMGQADEAMASGDYDKALQLYDGLLAWKGEGVVPASDRCKASLESVKCLILLKRPEEGVERFKGMYQTFAADMEAPDGYKKALAVLSTLIQEKVDPGVSIGLLALATEKHPGQKENFAKWVEALKKQGLSGEDEAALSQLGYL
ncbi:MAG: hypothetical protein HY812_11290 [Planctomycetes bacterium]|nr:hypothetical protein [Planctomycetota bacterium]